MFAKPLLLDRYVRIATLGGCMCVFAAACGGGGPSDDDAGTDGAMQSDGESDGATLDGGQADGDLPVLSIGGTATGSINGLVLALAVDGSFVEDANVNVSGIFQFDADVHQGDDYTVTVSPETQFQDCEIAAFGSGTVGATDVTNIEVRCVSTTDFSALSGATCEDEIPSVAWNAIAVADSYLVRFTPVGGGANIEVTEPAPSTALTIDPGLGSGNFTVRIAAKRGGLTSPFSPPMNLGVFDALTNAPSATPPAPACVGDNVMLTATGAEGDQVYVWSGPNGFMRTEETFGLAIESAASFGTYSVALVNGPCTSPATDVPVLEAGACP